ncbi:CcoQ/FixQ family Cbb3-type cytochrome c oxidase assembly chaperone [Conchiformibius steedae DSM 2580]|uniref:CcoQ/FixQ family Cbb3-type cytochrome c oxidase assembly chaperone n=2 Tax=Conchiformibius steedae TaxID=153493 RepID=A0A3P2A6F3_9NEIS|nr:CcoQ/FixQ family Cbb3-type cytochrome c oxidase assembly chaperone [Conchiformibius steedae]QMT33173.1 CcoQ/FixQ family Cbb3-type cytochrome c oxidase assembly chaperone [Conchiformibius steedae]RRD91001.1 CcoQ/FixQ family Cbb3-type cytochrome c oxidase assembly chaperone [Conchiformibius steedae]URD67810.1 CcoQ/FixQ family Cbb3-type cytochrome c oxidase assembly chaperone [Conchiformibius steedae DSM 2580]
MDLNSARTLFTVWVFVCFALVLYIVLSKRNKDGYQDAARSIVDDPDTPDAPAESHHNNGAK